MTIQIYKIVVTPTSARHAYLDESRCLYSISLGAPDKTIDDVLEGLAWTTARFQDVAVLIGDSLLVLTLQIQKGLEYSVARTEAASLAGAMASAVRVAYPSMTVFSSEELHLDGSYQRCLARIRDAVTSDGDLSHSIDRDALEFLNRQARRARLALPKDAAMTLAREYLIQEVAIYSHMASVGWRLDVYLGSELTTLAGIINGTVPSPTPELSRRINVSLRRKAGQ